MNTVKHYKDPVALFHLKANGAMLPLAILTTWGNGAHVPMHLNVLFHMAEKKGWDFNLNFFLTVSSHSNLFHWGFF